MQTEPAESGPQYVKRERVFVGAFLLCVCISLTHFIWSSWLIAAAVVKAGGSTGAPSYPFAPNAYRIGVGNLGSFLVWLLPARASVLVGPLIEFVSVSVALTLLYLLTVEGLGDGEGSRQRRLTVVALFLAFLQFPLAWVVPYQRPETLPTALYVATGLWCLVRARRSWVWVAVLLAATYLQAFVRSDVPFIFGVTLLVLSLTNKLAAWGSRGANLLRAVGVIAIGAGVQLYLQLIRFPHLKYAPGVPVVMFSHNLGTHVISVFLIALLPFIGLTLLLIVRPMGLQPMEAFTVTLCALYLPVWFSVGSASEVRIFVPFLFALCMVAARVVAAFVVGPTSSTSPAEFAP